MCRGRAATIVGTERADTITGTDGNDVIVALAGADVIHGLAGNDIICAGRGADVVDGGEGRDRIYGEAGYDDLTGGAGRDRIYGHAGGDLLEGSSGRDVLRGGDGSDTLRGGGGDDVMFGGPGAFDVFRGGSGRDRFEPGSETWVCRDVGEWETCGRLGELARDLLTELTVVEEWPPFGPYDRNEYDGGWLDADQDCVNTRHEILQRDSLTPVVMDGCSVVSGTWVDHFTGTTYTDAVDATIDHFIPIDHAHQAGAWKWDGPTKKAFANDLGYEPALQIAGDAVNVDKGFKGPEEWKPPLESAWCQYAVDWIGTKTRWDLPVRTSERSALESMLDDCTGAELTRVWPPPAASIVRLVN